MEIPIKMDDLGVPPFKETPIYMFGTIWEPPPLVAARGPFKAATLEILATSD